MARVPDDEDGDGKWYFSRKEIEENSPSRRDGINLKKETYFRKSYCTFLHDLGVKIEVPQVAIATATIFCHRFFLRQSHAKHDRLKIGTACLFLASKVEETRRPLRDVILVSYQIIHRKDSETVKRIFKKEGVYEKEKGLILHGEILVLKTLDFDLNVKHPYKLLVDAIKKFKDGSDDQKSLAKVAWNFVNDGLRTSLCLQFKPRQVAAAAFFLAAKFLKIKLHSDWRHEFAVTPGQLEEVSNQILELYDQDSGPRASQAQAGGAEAMIPKVLDSGDNAHNRGDHPKVLLDQKNAHISLDDSDSEKHKKIACDKINSNQQSTKKGQLSPNNKALTIDFEPKGQQEERIGTIERMLKENNVKAAMEKGKKLGSDLCRESVCKNDAGTDI